MAYGDFKNLPRGTASDKVLHDKAFNIAKNSKYKTRTYFIRLGTFLIKSLLVVVLKVKLCRTSN